MSLHSDIIAGMRANLTAEVGARPTGALGFGRDLWCTTSVTDDLREVDPDSPLGIAQTALRACTTPRDTCPDAPGRGFDVRRALNKGTTRDELLAYNGMCRGEIEQDDRVLSVETKLTLTSVNGAAAVRLEFRVFPRNPQLQPFAGVFVIPATGAATLELLGE